MISAVILTLNEEKNITGCIDALRGWCDDVVVFDSFSSDRTVELAKASGARVFQRKFDNYAAQRNAALKEIEYPGEWVVFVDADERWRQDIGGDVLQLISSPENAGVDLIFFRRRDIFRGRWLKHNIGAGSWFGRVMRHANCRVERAVNEEYVCDGRKLYREKTRFDHYPFSNGMRWWIERHNRYSDMEASVLASERREKVPVSRLFSRDGALRRKAAKQLLYRLPCRPLLMFFTLYFLKFGFLDGAAGFHYSVLRSFYEYMIDLKTYELKHPESDGAKGGEKK